VKISQVLQNNTDSTPFDFKFEYQQLSDKETKNSMSINELMQQKFNHKLDQLKQGPNETINSSNLVMNHRDR
jgi:low affinity Fe/Cu permease